MCPRRCSISSGPWSASKPCPRGTSWPLRRGTCSKLFICGSRALSSVRRGRKETASSSPFQSRHRQPRQPRRPRRPRTAKQCHRFLQWQAAATPAGIVSSRRLPLRLLVAQATLSGQCRARQVRRPSILGSRAWQPVTGRCLRDSTGAQYSPCTRWLTLLTMTSWGSVATSGKRHHRRCQIGPVGRRC